MQELFEGTYDDKNHKKESKIFYYSYDINRYLEGDTLGIFQRKEDHTFKLIIAGGNGFSIGGL